MKSLHARSFNQVMAAADVAAEPVVEPEEDNEDECENAVSYPLRVDYCGLCSMPPEVATLLAMY